MSTWLICGGGTRASRCTTLQEAPPHEGYSTSPTGVHNLLEDPESPPPCTKKTAAIVRNCGGMEWARCFWDIGVDVKNFVKYLGVCLGNVRHQ